MLMSLLHGCSVNPVSGKNEFVMMREAELQPYAEGMLSMLNDYPSGEPSPAT